MNDRSLAPMLEVQEFDEWDKDLMHDVCGPSLATPIQNLLLTLSNIKMVCGSFGYECLAKAEVISQIELELEALRAACKTIWEDK